MTARTGQRCAICIGATLELTLRDRHGNGTVKEERAAANLVDSEDAGDGHADVDNVGGDCEATCQLRDTLERERTDILVMMKGLEMPLLAKKVVP